jgi:hypothetical protein
LAGWCKSCKTNAGMPRAHDSVPQLLRCCSDSRVCCGLTSSICSVPPCCCLACHKVPLLHNCRHNNTHAARSMAVGCVSAKNVGCVCLLPCLAGIRVSSLTRTVHCISCSCGGPTSVGTRSQLQVLTVISRQISSPVVYTWCSLGSSGCSSDCSTVISVAMRCGCWRQQQHRTGREWLVAARAPAGHPADLTRR